MARLRDIYAPTSRKYVFIGSKTTSFQNETVKYLGPVLVFLR